MIYNFVLPHKLGASSELSPQSSALSQVQPILLRYTVKPVLSAAT